MTTPTKFKPTRTDDEIQCIRAVIRVLRSPRNRFGRLDVSQDDRRTLDAFGMTFGLVPNGVDAADKAQMILSRMLGDLCLSVVAFDR